MSKAVLISIRPKWCELIASGEKTIEVRKTAPKIPTPFKCYIYCTKDKRGLDIETDRDPTWLFGTDRDFGKVIGEFVCDEMFKFSTRVYLGDEQEKSDDEIVSKSCVPRQELRAYEGSHFGICGWHISELVIYDTPKKLSEFTPCCKFMLDEKQCDYRKVKCLNQQDSFMEEDGCNCLNFVRRPPQSWCYVEVLS